MTLGKRLKERELRDAALALQRAEEEARRRKQEEVESQRRVLEEVKGFFARVRSEIIEDIQADRAIRKLTLGYDGDGTKTLCHILGTDGWFSASSRITHPEHPFHSVWLEFHVWAAAEELDIELEYNHDEFLGIWFVLNVKSIA